MAQFLNDTFTDTDSKALTGAGAHVGETGATWAGSYDAQTAVEIYGNRLRNSGASALTSLLYSSGVPASADYDVEATYYISSTDNNGVASIAGRVATGAVTCYGVWWYNGAWDLYKIVGGAYTSLGTWSEALSATNTRAVKLEMRGTAIKAYIAGTVRISVTNGDITDAGRAGVYAYNNLTGGAHLENITATDAATSIPIFAHYYQQG